MLTSQRDSAALVRVDSAVLTRSFDRLSFSLLGRLVGSARCEAAGAPQPQLTPHDMLCFISHKRGCVRVFRTTARFGRPGERVPCMHVDLGGCAGVRFGDVGVVGLYAFNIVGRCATGVSCMYLCIQAGVRGHASMSRANMSISVVLMF